MWRTGRRPPSGMCYRWKHPSCMSRAPVKGSSSPFDEELAIDTMPGGAGSDGVTDGGVVVHGPRLVQPENLTVYLSQGDFVLTPDKACIIAYGRTVRGPLVCRRPAEQCLRLHPGSGPSRPARDARQANTQGRSQDDPARTEDHLVTPRPDVWSVGLMMVDDLFVEGEPRAMGLLAGGAAYACVGVAYAGARAGLVARAGAGIDPDALAQLEQRGLVLESEAGGRPEHPRARLRVGHQGDGVRVGARFG